MLETKTTKPKHEQYSKKSKLQKVLVPDQDFVYHISNEDEREALQSFAFAETYNEGSWYD